MDQEELLETLSKLRKFLRNRGHPYVYDHAEDIVNYAATKYINGRCLRTPFRHILTDYLRQTKGDNRYHSNVTVIPTSALWEGKFLENIPDMSPDAEEILQKKEKIEFIKDNLDKFVKNKKHKQIIAYMLENKTTEEIATLMKIKPETVNTHMHFIRKRLLANPNFIKTFKHLLR